MKFAFSLLELGVLVLGLSLLLAAFAPVISSKMNDGLAVDQGKKLATVCGEFSEYCALCYKGKECIVCERECISGVLDSIHCVCN